MHCKRRNTSVERVLQKRIRRKGMMSQKYRSKQELWKLGRCQLPNWLQNMIYLRFKPWKKYTRNDCFPTEDTEGTSIFMKESISLEIFWAFITTRRTVMSQPTLTHRWQSWWRHSASELYYFAFRDSIFRIEYLMSTASFWLIRATCLSIWFSHWSAAYEFSKSLRMRKHYVSNTEHLSSQAWCINSFKLVI